MTLRGCFLLLFVPPFIWKPKYARLKNPTDLLHKNLMKPLKYESQLALTICSRQTLEGELKGRRGELDTGNRLTDKWATGLKSSPNFFTWNCQNESKMSNFHLPNVWLKVHYKDHFVLRNRKIKNHVLWYKNSKGIFQAKNHPLSWFC